MSALPKPPSDDDRINELIVALISLRGHWLELSLALSDLLTEIPSAERDAVSVEVQNYLLRFRVGARNPLR